MGFDDNNNSNTNQQQQQQQPNVNTPITLTYQTPSYVNGPVVTDGFSIGPNAYQYMPLNNNNNNFNNNNNNKNNTTGNNNNAYYGYPGQAYPAPPGVVYQQYVPANNAVLTTGTYQTNSISHESHTECKRSYFHAEEVTGALIIFLCGFFLSCIWLAGCIYFKSKNTTARALGILSVVLFTFFTILSVVLISVIFSQAGNYDDSSSYSESSSSSYW